MFIYSLDYDTVAKELDSYIEDCASSYYVIRKSFGPRWKVFISVDDVKCTILQLLKSTLESLSTSSYFDPELLHDYSRTLSESTGIKVSGEFNFHKSSGLDDYGEVGIWFALSDHYRHDVGEYMM